MQLLMQQLVQLSIGPIIFLICLAVLLALMKGVSGPTAPVREGVHDEA